MKNGKSVDPAGLVREVFKKGGKSLRRSIHMMMNTIKITHVFPLQWSQMYIQTVKNKNGSLNKLESYRGIFLVPILSLILEKLLKNRMQPTLENNMSKFQTGGAKGKGVVDNLFILRGLIDHTNYLGKELWITFYDIEKCFDSLWLEDCINAPWRNGIQDDILYQVYLMNRKAHVTAKTPFGDSHPFITTDLVKQGACLGPIPNNCSLSDICTEGTYFNYGSVQIKSLEFVDDVADLNSGNAFAVLSNDIMCNIQRKKRPKFSTEKCKLLKVNSKDNGDTISISGEKVEVKTSFRYLGDIFNYRGDNSDLCKERARKAIGISIEIISLCKEINFGKNQISEMLPLCHSVFLPRFVYNCEAWTNLTRKETTHVHRKTF